VIVKRRTTLARRLRRDMTEAEKRLWRELREFSLPQRYRRQHPIGRHIVDFACPAAKLVIELDGGQHVIVTDDDHNRSSEIERHGYRVIRFWNGDVMENIEGVLETICRELEISLSALGGGEGWGEVRDPRRRYDPPHPPYRWRDGSPPSPPASGRRGR
jgi:very-short-patch-repair endonuclease